MKKKPSCIFVQARAEYEFAPIWFKHYSQFFDTSDMFCVSNDPSGSGLEDFGVKTIYKPVDLIAMGIDAGLRINACSTISELLNSYEWVVFTEIDELIVPNPVVYPSFKDILSGDSNRRCTGYEIIQQPGELSYDPGIKILDQRGFWIRAPMYDKTLILRTVPEYAPGFHSAFPEVQPDAAITLFHLHWFDLGICNKKYQRTSSWNWGNEKKTTSIQNKKGYCISDKINKISSQVCPIPLHYANSCLI